jgi:ribosomal protein S18 acetylase RimI-like enzyme
MWSVRILSTREWQLMRDLRIEAVRDSPDAFQPTLAEVLAEPDGYWRRLTESLGHPDNDLLIATHPLHGDRGTTYVRVDADGVGHIGAMWVAPELRGRGLGQMLFAAALEWHQNAGRHTVELSVTEGNAPAQRLYQRNGFVLTGATGLLRDGSPLRTLVMRRDLTG